MILHTIRVENWRCFLAPVAVGPLSDGLNVIYAPNGSGKSKLFEALHRTLLDSHRVTGQDIQAVQPWGRVLTPRVCLEFSERDTAYRLTKQFLNAPSALLERRENGHFVRLAEGVAAEDTVRKMLSSEAAGRGLTKQQHWGIAQVLWAPQGQLRLGELSDSLVADIRASLSAQMTGARGLSIQRKIEALYHSYYTARDKLSSGKGSPLAQLQKRLAAAEAELAVKQAVHELFELTATRVAELTDKSRAADLHVAELQQQVEALNVEAAGQRELLADVERWRERVTTISSQLDALQQRIERTTALTARVERGNKALEEHARKRAQAALEVQRLAASEAEAQISLESAQADHDGLASLRDATQAAADLQDAMIEQERLETRLGPIREACRVADECSSRAAGFLAPGAAELAKIRHVVRQRDESQVRLEASLLHLELIPEQRENLRVVSGDQSGEQLVLESGTAVRVDGSPEVEVAVDGFGRIRAWGPEGSAEEHRRALAEAVYALAELTEPYGTDDLTALEALYERSTVLEAEASDAKVRREALLNGERIEDLEKEAETRATMVKDLLDSRREWVESPPDADALAEELRCREEQAEDALRGAKSVCERARREADDARNGLNQLDIRIDQARETLRTDEEELVRVTSDQEPLDELGTRVAQLRDQLHGAQKQRTQIEQLRGERGGSVLVELEQLTTRHCQAVEGAREAREEVVREEAQLRLIESQAPYSRLVETEEAVDQLRTEVAQEELKANAVRLLYDTVTECQERAHNAVIGRVESSAEEILEHIAGDYLGDVHFSDSFSPQGVVPPALEEVVSLDNLSGGETEQLYLATRLALATFLADKNRQMVVLDDVLSATDSVRLDRILQTLDEASEHLQVIILTCHVDRYKPLTKAKFFDLEVLKKG